MKTNHRIKGGLGRVLKIKVQFRGVRGRTLKKISGERAEKSRLYTVRGIVSRIGLHPPPPPPNLSYVKKLERF